MPRHFDYLQLQFANLLVQGKKKQKILFSEFGWSVREDEMLPRRPMRGNVAEAFGGDDGGEGERPVAAAAATEEGQAQSRARRSCTDVPLSQRMDRLVALNSDDYETKTKAVMKIT